MFLSILKGEEEKEKRLSVTFYETQLEIKPKT